MVGLLVANHYILHHWTNIPFLSILNPLITSTSIKLSELLKMFRRQNHYCQKEIASKLKITREYYWRIENEKDIPSIEILIKICKMLGLSIQIDKYGEVRSIFKKNLTNVCERCQKLKPDERKMIEYMVHKCEINNSSIDMDIMK
jgi:DNA-binding XRE family transcriptional regulator